VCVLLVAGFIFPVWELRADVRSLGMFPEGFIQIRLSGRGIAGHIQSFNRFGGMFGIRPLKPEEFIELRLYPVAVAAAVVATVLWGVRGARWLRLAALVLLWGIPVGAMGLTQLRLAIMAYTRDPMAPYYMEVSSLLLPVFGTKKILGAIIYTLPGPGLALFIAAALLFSLFARRET
jgi:hypothetical protein